MTTPDLPLSYVHLDGFSSRPYSGNSLAIFTQAPPLGDQTLAAITWELHHFESIFLQAISVPNTVRARVFHLVGELEFAGHPSWERPVCSTPNRRTGNGMRSSTLKAKRVEVKTMRRGGFFEATLNQGAQSGWGH